MKECDIFGEGQNILCLLLRFQWVKTPQSSTIYAPATEIVFCHKSACTRDINSAQEHSRTAFCDVYISLAISSILSAVWVNCVHLCLAIF